MTNNVSIHAPVRERHFPHSFSDGAQFVSIHAPVRERQAWLIGLRAPFGFNPRPRKGATDAGGACNEQKSVSIHAPVRERHFIFLPSLSGTRFQSTPP